MYHKYHKIYIISNKACHNPTQDQVLAPMCNTSKAHKGGFLFAATRLHLKQHIKGSNPGPERQKLNHKCIESKMAEVVDAASVYKGLEIRNGEMPAKLVSLYL